ncbi:hypothetical protein RFI_32684, partial [Reticulomyxa filosa]
TSEESISTNESDNETVLNEFNVRTGDLNELFYKPVTKRNENESESDTEKASNIRYKLLDDVISHTMTFCSVCRSWHCKLLFRPHRVATSGELKSTMARRNLQNGAHCRLCEKDMLTETKDQTAISVLKNEKPATELDCIVFKDKQYYDVILQASENSTLNRTNAFASTQNANSAGTEQKAVVVNDMQIKLAHENIDCKESNICKMLLSRTYNHTYEFIIYAIHIYYLYADNIQKKIFFFDHKMHQFK